MERGDEIILLTLEHLQLTVISIGLAVLFAVPTGIFLTRTPKISSTVMGVVSAIQTIPSLALFGLVIPVLMMFGLPIIGWVPALLALFLYALLPILRNTFIGIKQVDQAMIEAGKGMGMTNGQILWRVELPLSLPIIMAGIRTSTVISVGIATLAALIGAGGLGELIFRGLRTINYKLMLAGAIPAASLALLLDFALSLAGRLLTPKGLKIAR
jgi:osmoprotectant transport system permease protein